MISAAQPGALRWKGADGDLLVREWDVEVAVFQVQTGATHLLSSDAAALLQNLRASAEALAAAQLWRNAFGIEPGDNDLAMLEDSLQRLARFGLVTALSA